MSLKSRLQQLDDVEKDVAESLRIAAQCLAEAGKEKIAPKSIERHATEYLTKLKNVEMSLLEQINYLNQIGAGAAHEGSAYLSLRQQRFANDRSDYFDRRLSEAIEIEDQQNQSISSSISESNVLNKIGMSG